ncbi:MAG: AcrR family transcriptional regulator [Myxococcota bacterium]|jgi:AcrR family transcriptional regulator
MEPWTIDEIGAALAAAMGSSPGEAKPRAALRLRILQVASDHFERFGYRRTNIGDVARDAGIGKGSLYLHFDSKKTLLLACLAYEKLALVPELEATLELPAADRLRRHLEIAFRFAIDAPLTSAFLRGDPELVAAVAPYMAAHRNDRERSRAFMASLIDPGGQLSEPRRAVLVEAVHGLTALTAHLPQHAETLELQPERVGTTLAGLLARGVAAELAE